MKIFKLVHTDRFDEVRDLNTGDTIFSTKLPEYITKYIDRVKMNKTVIDEVISIWNAGKGLGELGPEGELDKYLLHEGGCTQEEREIIVGKLYDHA